MFTITGIRTNKLATPANKPLATANGTVTGADATPNPTTIAPNTAAPATAPELTAMAVRLSDG